MMLVQVGLCEVFCVVDFDVVLVVVCVVWVVGVCCCVVVLVFGVDVCLMVFYNCIKGEVEDVLIGLGFECFVIV